MTCLIELVQYLLLLQFVLLLALHVLPLQLVLFGGRVPPQRNLVMARIGVVHEFQEWMKLLEWMSEEDLETSRTLDQSLDRGHGNQQLECHRIGDHRNRKKTLFRDRIPQIELYIFWVHLLWRILTS